MSEVSLNEYIGKVMNDLGRVPTYAEVEIYVNEHWKQKTTELENKLALSEARLEKCKDQRNGEIWQAFDSQGSKETINAYDTQLNSLTLDSLDKEKK